MPLSTSPGTGISRPINPANRVGGRRSSSTPRLGVPEGSSRLVTGPILSAGNHKTMRTKTEDEMRTALRQSGAITAVDGQHSIRQRLGVAHQLYDAMLLLEPDDRARRSG